MLLSRERRGSAGLALSLCGALVLAVFGEAAQADALHPMPARKPSPIQVMQIHSGHSLTDTYMSWPWPGRLTLATEKLPGSNAHNSIGKSTIPGAALSWRWGNSSGDPDARLDIARFELLVTTESVPLSPDPGAFEVDTLDWLDKWVAHAWKNGNGGAGAEVMLYSTWVWWRNAEDTGPDGEAHIPFRERLEIDGARWEAMQDRANANRPEGMPLIYMIPGHRLMMRIYDDIEDKAAPGLSSIGDIFFDDIHLNDLGHYAITVLVYAVIYQRDPVEVPDRLAVKEDTLTKEQAKYFKKIAWEVATTYNRAGVPAP